MSKEYRGGRKCSGAHAEQHPQMTTSNNMGRGKWLIRSAQTESQKKHRQERRNLERLAIISQFCHLVSFTLKRPRTKLECGALITSIDVDVGSSRLGEINRGRNDSNVHDYLSEQ
ncbi:hypothetical protein MUP77_04605, partial [Candidatus Bathyarchaeota archaeon]|nr:hypothetical protein [Candidatus Bathyarchaeota archaeon]